MKSLMISAILMVLASFFAALGQLSLKIGAMKIKKSVNSLLKNPVLLFGVFFYGLSSIVSLFAVKDANLTALYPFASLNYVWVSVLSMRFLKEKMNKYKWIGIFLIIIGVSVTL
ncbi:MAG: EamA family transporter [Nanoarchaeota archaeon]